MGECGRRKFLQGAALLAMAEAGERLLFADKDGKHSDSDSVSKTALDTHIHLFDPTRSGGVPWPTKADGILFQPALPARYRALAEPMGIVGAIAIECSPLASDNDWLLKTAESSEFIVGVIGDLDLLLPNFEAELQRLAANPLFKGIRYGNLWGRDLAGRSKEKTFVDNMKLLAKSNLLLESANPNPRLIAGLLQLTRLVPDLRIVIDHLPQAPPPVDSESREMYLTMLRELAKSTNVYVKGTEILRRIDGKVPTPLETYRPWLDEIWSIFGDDRMLFGSDWPNSDTMAPFDATVSVAQQYIQPRGKVAAEKYLWRNSVKVYGWKARTPAQAELIRSAG